MEVYFPNHNLARFNATDEDSQQLRPVETRHPSSNQEATTGFGSEQNDGPSTDSVNQIFVPLDIWTNIVKHLLEPNSVVTSETRRSSPLTPLDSIFSRLAASVVEYVDDFITPDKQMPSPPPSSLGKDSPLGRLTDLSCVLASCGSQSSIPSPFTFPQAKHNGLRRRGHVEFGFDDYDLVDPFDRYRCNLRKRSFILQKIRILLDLGSVCKAFRTMIKREEFRPFWSDIYAYIHDLRFKGIDEVRIDRLPRELLESDVIPVLRSRLGKGSEHIFATGRTLSLSQKRHKLIPAKKPIQVIIDAVMKYHYGFSETLNLTDRGREERNTKFSTLRGVDDDEEYSVASKNLFTKLRKTVETWNSTRTNKLVIEQGKKMKVLTKFARTYAKFHPTTTASANLIVVVVEGAKQRRCSTGVDQQVGIKRRTITVQDDLRPRKKRRSE